MREILSIFQQKQILEVLVVVVLVPTIYTFMMRNSAQFLESTCAMAKPHGIPVIAFTLEDQTV